MGLNVGGLYVRSRGVITQEAVRDAVTRYWTNRGAKPCERPPSAHEPLGLESTGQVCVGVFPDIEGWIGIYDSERYRCDSDLVEFLAKTLETEVVGFSVTEAADEADMVRRGPSADDAIQVPADDEPYWNVIELVEGTFPYPFVYFDQLVDDAEGVFFLSFEGIGPSDDHDYGGASEEELQKAAAAEKRRAAIAGGDLSELHALLAENAEAASELVDELEDELSPAARLELVAVALKNPALKLPPDFWLDAFEKVVGVDDLASGMIKERFEALGLDEGKREHLFSHRRYAMNDLIRSGDHLGMLAKWEALILLLPDEAQSLYSLVMSLRAVRDATSDTADKARYTMRIAELGEVLQNLEPKNWLDASYRAYALNDCFACELCDQGTTEEEWERGLEFSNASLGPFAWNLYHQGTKAEMLVKLGRTSEGFALLRWIEKMHPRLLPDSPPMAALYTDDYKKWALKAKGVLVHPDDTEVPGVGDTLSPEFARDPMGIDPAAVKALLSVRTGEDAWERARRAALVSMALDPVVRREMDGDVAEWLTQIEFHQVDLRSASFGGQELAPETVERARHWYILSTINPFMAQPGTVYLFGEWKREPASKAWVEKVLGETIAEAGLPEDTLDAILKRGEASMESRPTIMPFDGAADSLFDDIGDDTVEVWVLMVSAGEGWVPAVRSQLEPGWKSFERWIGDARSACSDVKVDCEGHHVSLKGATRELLQSLETAIPTDQLVEIVLTRTKQGAPVPHPNAPVFSGTPEDDDEALWIAAFEGEPPPAPTLDEMDPCDYFDPDEMLEIRLPVYDADVRVVYGICDEVEDLEWEPRCTEVSKALIAAFAKRFGGPAPSLWNKAGAANGPVDRIERGGRRGFGFAVQMNDDHMFRVYPGAVRFREPELLAALCDVVKSLGLAPVVQWVRYDPYIINLWEK